MPIELLHPAELPKFESYVKTGDPGAGAGRFAQAKGTNPVNATTLIGAATLAEPDLPVEVEAVAVPA
jgi:hypothetical protein